MVTMAQRIEALRTQRGLSRPALSAALGLPRLSVEKFETGRQTPTQEQQTRLANYFGVSVFYLRGESDDPSSMDSWLSGAGAAAEDAPSASSRPAPQPPKSKASSPAEDGAVFTALLNSKSFRSMVEGAVLDVLRSPQGQELLARAIEKKLGR